MYHRGSGSKALEVCWPSFAVCFNWNGPRQEYYFNKVSFTRFNPIPSGLSEDVNVLRDLSRDGRDLVSLILISNPTFISFRTIPTLMGRGSRGWFLKPRPSRAVCGLRQASKGGMRCRDEADGRETRPPGQAGELCPYCPPSWYMYVRWCVMREFLLIIS